jgi:hypothetical protein
MLSLQNDPRVNRSKLFIVYTHARSATGMFIRSVGTSFKGLTMTSVFTITAALICVCSASLASARAPTNPMVANPSLQPTLPSLRARFEQSTWPHYAWMYHFDSERMVGYLEATFAEPSRQSQNGVLGNRSCLVAKCRPNLELGHLAVYRANHRCGPVDSGPNSLRRFGDYALE